jgi:hypothetical protein
MEINQVRGFVQLHDPDDLVTEAHRHFFWIRLKNSPDGIEVPDMMKRQERTFCTLMIPVPVQVDHKRYVCITEFHRLERSIMVLTINRD